MPIKPIVIIIIKATTVVEAIAIAKFALIKIHPS